MNKVAHYLQEHLTGEVMDAPDVREYFATDASILELAPAIVVYPRNENDVRKATRFTWQLAERGRVVPITARGSGTDLAGGALGKGIMLVFPAHMNKILELDTRSGLVTIEPGLNYAKLQQTLHTHGRFLPPFPASVEYSTIGGAIANNASGEKSVKYGSTEEFTESLRVVLANGEVIETGRLSKRELSKKLGLASFEGEIYRTLDALIEENHDLIQSLSLATSKNSAGYNLGAVKNKDGSFDLTPLIVGSQGTLGIVTEAVMAAEPYNPVTTLVVAHFDEVQQLQDVIVEIKKMKKSGPCAVEVVDENLLNYVQRVNPNQLRGALDQPFSKFVLLVEFDDLSAKVQKKSAKKLSKLLDKYGVRNQVEVDPEKKEQLWKIRQSASALLAYSDGNVRALPFIEDGIVPAENLKEFITRIYQLFDVYNMPVAIWGHAGDANLHVQPLLDLGNVGDRQRLFRLLDDYYTIIVELGGSTSAQNNDGRVRAPYLEKLYGPDAVRLFEAVKHIFDPHGILNPGVKLGSTVNDVKPLLRSSYSLKHLYDHLPRS
jgi:FAD/FMN-containing dehydrogenase